MSNGELLNDSKTYKIATIDFCVPLLMGEFDRIKGWYNVKDKYQILGDFTDKIGEELKKITKERDDI